MAKATNIADLKQDARNPRKHNERNLKVIVDSLQDVGFARSIVIDEENNILAGNGVTEAAAIAGIEKVVEVEADGNTIIAVRRRGLTNEQKQRLKYFDNRSGELAEWEPSQLLIDIGAGLDLSALFREDELDRLLGNSSEIDINAEWQGMPEFEQPDTMAYRTIYVHFADEEAVHDFADKMNQKLTDKTKYIWHPAQKPQKRLDMQYVTSDES